MPLPFALAEWIQPLQTLPYLIVTPSLVCGLLKHVCVAIVAQLSPE